MRLRYDIVPHHGGWAIDIVPSRNDKFASKPDSFTNRKAAFDVAAELARKLRFTGISLHIRADHENSRAERRKAS